MIASGRGDEVAMMSDEELRVFEKEHGVNEKIGG